MKDGGLEVPELTPEELKRIWGPYEFPESVRTLNGRLLSNLDYAEVTCDAHYANGRAAPWKAYGILRQEYLRLKSLLKGLTEAGLKAELWNLQDATEGLLDAQNIPPKNCSCHLNPPCEDCVEYGGLREAVEVARAALKPVARGESADV